MKERSKARLCIACGLPSATFRGGGAVKGLACRTCARLSSFKWESAVEEWNRLLAEERRQAKAAKGG